MGLSEEKLLKYMAESACSVTLSFEELLYEDNFSELYQYHLLVKAVGYQRIPLVAVGAHVCQVIAYAVEMALIKYHGYNGETMLTRNGAWELDGEGYLCLSNSGRILGENGEIAVGAHVCQVIAYAVEMALIKYHAVAGIVKASVHVFLRSPNYFI